MLAMTEQDFLSPQEIARQLNVTDRAVLDMITAGKLEAVRVGAKRGVWRVPRASLNRYLSEQSAKGSINEG